jgi:anti-anti-sigma factor
MFEIRSARSGYLTVIEVSGRIDSISAARLESAVAAEGAGRRIVLDLGGVDYLSGAGLRTLKRLSEPPDGIRLARPSDRVREVLQIIGLDGALMTFPTRTEAIRSITHVTNAHTHMELDWLAEALPPVSGTPFVQWIRGIVGRIQALRTKGEWEIEYRRAAETSVQRLIDAGTTSIGDISIAGLSIPPLLESGLSGVAYVELLVFDAVAGEERLKQVQAIIDQWRPKERHGMRVGLEIHAPYSVHPTTMKAAIEYARREALPVCIHVAESRAEWRYFTEGTGDLVEGYYNALNVPPVPSPHVSPVRYLDEMGALALKPLLVHAVQVDDDDIRRIKASGSSVAHCPRSNLRLQCGRMPLEQYLAAGVPVYLGTDGLSSAPSVNIFEEAELAAALHYERVPSEAIERLVYQAMP